MQYPKKRRQAPFALLVQRRGASAGACVEERAARYMVTVVTVNATKLAAEISAVLAS